MYKDAQLRREGEAREAMKYGPTYLSPAQDCKCETAIVSIPKHFVKAHHLIRDIFELIPKCTAWNSLWPNWWNLTLRCWIWKRGSFLCIPRKVSCLGDIFCCTTFGSSKVLYNLKVKVHGRSRLLSWKNSLPPFKGQEKRLARKNFFLFHVSIVMCCRKLSIWNWVFLKTAKLCGTQETDAAML